MYCSDKRYEKGYVQSQPGVKNCISIHFPWPQFRYCNIQNCSTISQNASAGLDLRQLQWLFGLTHWHLIWCVLLPISLHCFSHLAQVTSVFSSSYRAAGAARTSLCCLISSSALRWLTSTTDKMSGIILYKHGPPRFARSTILVIGMCNLAK